MPVLQNCTKRYMASNLFQLSGIDNLLRGGGSSRQSMADIYINCIHKCSRRAVPGPYYLVKHFDIPCKSSLL